MLVEIVNRTDKFPGVNVEHPIVTNGDLVA